MKNKELDIRITGSGNTNQIIAALETIISDLQAGSHVNGIQDKGEVIWENSILMTVIEDATETP